MFKPNYYLARSINASKTIEEGYKECKAFALHKHLLKGKCIWFKVTLKSNIMSTTINEKQLLATTRVKELLFVKIM